jgi:RNA polymerase sigma-70 factor (ECF subfamily)
MRKRGPVSVDEDIHLVSLCKKGDVDAFEELVKKHQKMIMNIAYRMLGNYEDAYEVVQDAFIAAYKGIRNFEEKASFSTWLYTIVVNLSRNRLKQIKTQQYYEKISIDDPAVADRNRADADPPSDEPSALERLERKDVQQQVQRCIDSLDSEFKEVVVLRDIESFSYDEISDMLKIPEGTVKSRLFRARHALKDCLKKFIGGL